MNELEPTINQRRRRWGGRRRWKGRSLKVERTKNVSVSFLLNDLQRLLPERKCHHHLHLLFHHHHHHHHHHHVFFFTRTFFHPTRPETIRNSAGIDLKWDRIGWIGWIGWVKCHLVSTASTDHWILGGDWHPNRLTALPNWDDAAKADCWLGVEKSAATLLLKVECSFSFHLTGLR